MLKQIWNGSTNVKKGTKYKTEWLFVYNCFKNFEILYLTSGKSKLFKTNLLLPFGSRSP